MKVSILDNGEEIWMRDADKAKGVTSKGYIKDGTQQKIIAALEDALAQAKGEYSVHENKKTEKIAEAITRNAMMNNCSRQQHS